MSIVDAEPLGGVVDDEGIPDLLRITRDIKEENHSKRTVSSISR